MDKDGDVDGEDACDVSFFKVRYLGQEEEASSAKERLESLESAKIKPKPTNQWALVWPAETLGWHYFETVHRHIKVKVVDNGTNGWQDCPFI